MIKKILLSAFIISALAGCSSDTPTKPDITGCSMVVPGFENKFPPLALKAKSPETQYMLRVTKVTIPADTTDAFMRIRKDATNYDFYNRLSTAIPSAKFEVLPILDLIPGKESVEENGYLVLNRNGPEKETVPSDTMRNGSLVRASYKELSGGVVEVALTLKHGTLVTSILIPDGRGGSGTHPLFSTEEVNTQVSVLPGYVVIIGGLFGQLDVNERKPQSIWIMELDRPYPNQAVKLSATSTR